MKLHKYTIVPILLAAVLGNAQITASVPVVETSINPKTDPKVKPINMVHLNYKKVYDLNADNSGGIIANVDGAKNGKVTLSVYNYNPGSDTGKGALVYQCYSDETSTDYIQKTTNMTIDIFGNTSESPLQVTVTSNDVKKLGQVAKLYTTSNCKLQPKITWRNTFFDYQGSSSSILPRICLDGYKPERPVIVEAIIKDATLHKFKVPGIGEFNASDFFDFQNKLKYLADNNVPRFAIIGDEGCSGNDERSVAALVKSWNPDFIVGMGDDNYEDVYKDPRIYGQFCGESIDDNCGQYYHEYIYPYHGKYGAGSPDKKNRFWSVLGNHDYKKIQGHPDDYLLREWQKFFTYPNNERYYDKQIGDVHLFALNTNVKKDGTPEDPSGRSATSVQALWLKDKLKASESKFKIVISHVPPYVSANPDGSHGSDPVLQWPYKLWGASIVLAGDQHFYERNLVENFTYVVNGSGGNVLNKNVKTYLPQTQVHYSRAHGAILAEVGENSITCTFYDINYHKVDEFTINKSSGAVESRAFLPKSTEADSELIVIAPNPNKGSFNIWVEAPTKTIAQIAIFNTVGQQLMGFDHKLSEGNNTIPVNGPKLPKGVYVLRITMNNETWTKRVLIE